VKSTNGNIYEFGQGLVVLNQTIEMLDAKKNLIRKPIEISILVDVKSAEEKKKLRARVRLFNIFTGKDETVSLQEGRNLDISVQDQFAYFQFGVSAPDIGDLPADAVQGTSVFCDFE
jgi:hypothetical protein